MHIQLSIIHSNNYCFHRLNKRKTATVEKGDYFKIRREQLEKQKKIAKKRNETFLKVGNTTLSRINMIYLTTCYILLYHATVSTIYIVSQILIKYF